MQEEGTDREVISRLQKLRKRNCIEFKAKLVPLDKVMLYYSVSPADATLCKIIKEHTTFIETAIRSPVRILPSPKNGKAAAGGAKLELSSQKVMPPDKPKVEQGRL